MKVAIPKERREGETRLAATPETVKKLVGLGLEVTVEAGAGAGAFIADAALEAAGAKLAKGAKATVEGADIVLKVRAPTPAEVKGYKSGATLVAIMNPYREADTIAACAAAGVDAFAMELLPRITRAQTMDVLSSQANLAGYKAVIDAAATFARAMPMMMTAAGTVAPAKVFIMGAGVAGLQAIATARRLGAVVSATDVRPVAREQVQSLGATFVMVESEETKAAETSGGYAREMSEDYKRRQAELISETIKKQDIVICTALIPGRPAPLLVSEEQVRSMKPGSVIVDLAVEQGGNCALSQPGKVVEVDGVTIMGHLNVPGRIAVDATSLYAKNLLNFLSPLIDKETKALKIDLGDEILKATCLTHAGEVVHPQFKEAAAAAAAAAQGAPPAEEGGE
ncbi:MAG: Re/Si-specific NAD(P)(+) transhydrogenase subunit alpha [Alphaproteobacteria bacterium]|nr:Re/Si-specific NAD(P)(+) transhydrogenase subunit alpha [Alphaproteobacteria bacterium]